MNITKLFFKNPYRVRFHFLKGRRKRKEKILERTLLNPPECIFVRKDQKLTIGSLFQSDIYYSYKDKIALQHGLLYFEGDDLYYVACREKDAKSAGAQKIDYGCELRIEGLYILNLKDHLLLQCLYGDMRVLKRRENAPH